MNKKDLLGQILIQQGSLTKEKLAEAIREHSKQGEYIGKILIEKGFASQDDVCRALAKQLNIKYVKLSEIDIDKEALYILPDYVIRQYKVLPIELKGEKLVVATADPLNLFTIENMKNVSGYKIEPILTSEKELDKYIDQYFGTMRKASQAMKEIKDYEPDGKDMSVEQIKAAVFEPPVIKLVNSVIAGALEQRASDIHMEPQEDKLIVRYRIDGILYDRMDIPKKLQATVISRIKIMADMDIGDKRRPQDGRIRMNYLKHSLDLRVSTLPVIHGEKAVIRLLDKSNLVLGLENLGMNKKQLDTFDSFIKRPHGIILVTGPTGSGKTTTLYSALTKINERTKNIITVEDPVEYQIKGINQVQVNQKADTTFAKSMRHIVRQDPDIIMIGEIRDHETAQIAIQAALTGHLVLSTLHTNDAPSAIVRLLDMKVEPFLIASSLIGVVAQRLTRILCPHCKKEFIPTANMLKSLKKKANIPGENINMASAVGCEKCGQIGYAGRIGIFEIMEISETIRDLTLVHTSSKDIKAKAKEEGMITLAENGMEKALSRVTSLEEIMRVVFTDEQKRG